MKNAYRIPEAEMIQVVVDIVTTSNVEDADNIGYLPKLPGWPGKL